MYERKVLQGTDIKTITDGAALPSVIKINSLNNYYIYKTLDSSTVNGNNICVLDGSIGNKKNAFSLSFYTNHYTRTNKIDIMNDLIDYNSSSNKLLIYSNIYKLYQSMQDNVLEVNKSFLANYFEIIEIPDYSSQTMTMKNFDIVVKVFCGNNKISNYYISILKSYTLKKAWILIDKRAVPEHAEDVNPIDKVIIDFNYKSFSFFNNISEIFKKSNSYSNLQDLFNSQTARSPYYDSYTIKNSEDTNYLLNKQEDYMSYENDELNTSVNYKDRYTKTNYVVNNSLIRNKDIVDTESYFLYKIVDEKAVSKYLNSLDYEVYKIKDNLILASSRVLYSTDISNEKAFYEVFTVNKNSAHYVFKITGAITDEDDYLDIFKKDLKYYKIYLGNTDFLNYNIFTINSVKYVEFYIPIVYDNSENNLSEISLEENHVAVLEYPEKFTNSYRSSYDPTFFNQSTYSNEKLIPYNGFDMRVSEVLEDGDPRFVSNDASFGYYNLKAHDEFDKKFDIRTSAEFSDDLTINETYKNNIHALGYKNIDIMNSNIKKYFKNLKSSYLSLNAEMMKLIPDKTDSNAIINSSIGLELLNKFYALFKSSSSSVKFKFTVTDNVGEITVEEILYSDVVEYGLYCFVIPGFFTSNENITSVKVRR